MMQSPHFVKRFFMAQGTSITVSPRLYIYTALSLILIPLPWLMGWFVAVLVHELFHCLALWICRKKIFYILIDINGAQIVTQRLTPAQTVFCSLAGPLGGALLLFFSPHFPRLGLCAFVQTTYNLLPVFPLDGGCAFRGLTQLLFSDGVSQSLCRIVEWLLFVSILVFSIYAAFILHLGAFPLFLAVIFVLRMKKIKIPCK